MSAIITPFVRAEYVGEPKNIGRFGFLPTGSVVTLTRTEWNTLRKNGSVGGWVHVEDSMESGPTTHPAKQAAQQPPTPRPRHESDSEKETQAGTGAGAGEQDDDGGGGATQQEDAGDTLPEVTGSEVADGGRKSSDSAVPVQVQEEEEEEDVEMLTYEECTVADLRGEIERRNKEEGAGLKLPPRARKKTLVAILEADDEADDEEGEV